MREEWYLYRPEEAALSLGISRARLYQLLATGEIASVKIGKSRRIASADLAAYVARLRTQQGVTTKVAPEHGNGP